MNIFLGRQEFHLKGEWSQTQKSLNTGISLDQKSSMSSKILIFRHSFQILKITRNQKNFGMILWKLLEDLKLDFPTDEPIASLTAKIKSWFQQFLSLYQDIRCDTLYACSLPSHSRIFETVYQCSTFQPARHGKIQQHPL